MARRLLYLNLFYDRLYCILQTTQACPLGPIIVASPAARPVPHTAPHPLLLLHYSTS